MTKLTEFKIMFSLSIQNLHDIINSFHHVITILVLKINKLLLYSKCHLSLLCYLDKDFDLLLGLKDKIDKATPFGIEPDKGTDQLRTFSGDAVL